MMAEFLYQILGNLQSCYGYSMRHSTRRYSLQSRCGTQASMSPSQEQAAESDCSVEWRQVHVEGRMVLILDVGDDSLPGGVWSFMVRLVTC